MPKEFLLLFFLSVSTLCVYGCHLPDNKYHKVVKQEIDIADHGFYTIESYCRCHADQDGNEIYLSDLILKDCGTPDTGPTPSPKNTKKR